MTRAALGMVAAAIVVAVAAAAPTGAQAPGPTFRTGTDRVRVDVLVTEDGEAVSHLKAGDLAIWDNGVLQQPEMVDAGGPVKVLLVLDISSSVAGERLQHLRAASSELLNALKDDDQVGLITFSERLDQLVPLTTDHEKVRAALERVQAGGRTALYDAVFTGLSLGAGESGRWLMLVFSDGADTASWLTATEVLDAAKRASLVVCGVTAGVAARANEAVPWLEEMVQTTGGRAVDAMADKEIGRVFVRLLEEYRSRYLLAYMPQGVPRGDGWHAIKVRVAGPRARTAKVTARRGYLSVE